MNALHPYCRKHVLQCVHFQLSPQLNEPFVLYGKKAVNFPSADVSCRPIQIYVLRNVLCGVEAIRSCLAARSLTHLRVGKPVISNTYAINLFLQNQTFHEYFRRYKTLLK